MIYILLFTIFMVASAVTAAWQAREPKSDDEEQDGGECGFELCSDYVETRCSACGQLICADETGTWVDNTGGDVCGVNGGNEPHAPW